MNWYTNFTTDNSIFPFTWFLSVDANQNRKYNHCFCLKQQTLNDSTLWSSWLDVIPFEKWLCWKSFFAQWFGRKFMCHLNWPVTFFVPRKWIAFNEIFNPLNGKTIDYSQVESISKKSPYNSSIRICKQRISTSSLNRSNEQCKLRGKQLSGHRRYWNHLTFEINDFMRSKRLKLRLMMWFVCHVILSEYCFLWHSLNGIAAHIHMY